MSWRQRIFPSRTTHSIEDVKKRLLFTFSAISLSSAFFVFFGFSLHLVFNEDAQIEHHLQSFEQIAKDHYALAKEDKVQISPHIMAYYSEAALDAKLSHSLPYQLAQVSKFNTFDEDGYMVYHDTFYNEEGDLIPLFLTIGSRSINFGDDTWDTLMLLSFALMIFLIGFLRFSLRRVFDGLMSPLSELSTQLESKNEKDFVVSERSIDELKQFTHHLNDYKQMKERLAKQEMMFAKYASHELKTPIAVVLGAANLQAMKEGDEPFQVKQRNRILIAASNMQVTVELLLNIVKQENVTQDGRYDINETALNLNYYESLLSEGVSLLVNIDSSEQTNLPEGVINMVLKNLLNNAIRFTQTGSITVTVAGDLISVVDTGKGLSGKPETEHGLGLLIVQRLCASYGWCFELKDNSDSKKGPGCSAILSR
ncbi:sensor histidine kinase [Aliivibrio wodanis]|uniref:sensor histidine kinase n=1 Tax=Aliivibrio wodanis TaxID=80852 RepID=UPI00406C3B08